MGTISKTLFIFPVDLENWRSAMLTIAAYRIMLRSRHDLSLLLETQRRRDEFPGAFLEEVCQDWGAVFIADKSFKAAVATALARRHLPWLFDPQAWNYCDPMNAALVVAGIADCRYVMRLDVDTLPYPDFEALVEEHTAMLDRGERVAVSTTYKGRYAIRWELVPGALRSGYLQLVKTYTGIDPYQQLTAGAGLTKIAPGYPDVRLRNQMAVGIDDADLTIRLGPRAGLSSPERIYRSLPGRSLDARAYAGRLARMVVVQALRNRATPDQALARADEFLRELERYFLVGGPFQLTGAVTLDDVAAIGASLADFDDLTTMWQDVVDAVRSCEAGLPPSSSCRLMAPPL